MIVQQHCQLDLVLAIAPELVTDLEEEIVRVLVIDQLLCLGVQVVTDLELVIDLEGVTDQELVIAPAQETGPADPGSAAETVPSSAVATRLLAEATTSTSAIAPAGVVEDGATEDPVGATVVDTATGATTGTATVSTIITTAGTTDAGAGTGEVVGMFRWSTEQPHGE